MIFFKMIEALRIREVDQMIESLQSEVSRPKVVVPEPSVIKIQSTTPEMASQIQKEEVVEVKPEPIVTPVKELGLEKFEQLIEKIADRNYELGECFKSSISFVSLSDNVLTWESCANEPCKKSLTHGYSVVKQLVREIFSFETKIKGVACTKDVEQTQEEVSHVANIQQPIMPEPQSATMIEDAEMGGNASCVSNCNDAAPLEESNGIDITQEPLVQKAIEMFEAKKVTVQSKI
jgi:DNA polymerase-3 subunit gamma/tau